MIFRNIFALWITALIDDFDYEKIALYNEEKIAEIMNIPDMIKSERKTKVQVSETETMTMAEIKKMQKKLALLEEENIILKKAMAIFSRESGKE